MDFPSDDILCVRLKLPPYLGLLQNFSLIARTSAWIEVPSPAIATAILSNHLPTRKSSSPKKATSVGRRQNGLSVPCEVKSRRKIIETFGKPMIVFTAIGGHPRRPY